MTREPTVEDLNKLESGNPTNLSLGGKFISIEYFFDDTYKREGNTVREKAQ